VSVGRRVAPGLLVAALLVTAACVRAQPSASASTATDSELAMDTLRGIVAIVGADPRTMAALRITGADGSSRTLVVDGPAAALMRRVEGAEVAISGRAQETLAAQFLAQRMVVRRVNDQPARDGTLESDGDGLVLRLTTGGRSPVVNASAGLRALVGARVWISGPEDAAPVSYGLIESPGAAR
jgi:hypothetical protein